MMLRRNKLYSKMYLKDPLLEQLLLYRTAVQYLFFGLKKLRS